MQSLFNSTVLKISQGLSRDKTISFLSSFLVGLTVTLPASLTAEGVTLLTPSLCWRGFWTVNTQRNFSVHNVKEWTAQQFVLGHWEKMLKGNIRDKAINLDDIKKIQKMWVRHAFGLDPHRENRWLKAQSSWWLPRGTGGSYRRWVNWQSCSSAVFYAQVTWNTADKLSKWSLFAKVHLLSTW